MRIEEILEKMIRETNGNTYANASRKGHDIRHFLSVHDIARMIGLLEGVSEETLFLLEAAAAVHDIACPLCREKYGSTDGKLQERESPALVAAFFAGTDLPAEALERISFLVSHHHTWGLAAGLDYEILLEADFFVNAMETGWTEKAREAFFTANACTESGKRLLLSLGDAAGDPVR